MQPNLMSEDSTNFIKLTTSAMYVIISTKRKIEDKILKLQGIEISHVSLAVCVPQVGSHYLRPSTGLLRLGYNFFQRQCKRHTTGNLTSLHIENVIKEVYTNIKSMHEVSSKKKQTESNI